VAVSIIEVVVSIGFEVAPAIQKYPDLSLVIAVAISSLELPIRKSQSRTFDLSRAVIKPSLPPRDGAVTKFVKPLSMVPTIAITVGFTVKSEI
jgi:hypothetical protein